MRRLLTLMDSYPLSLLDKLLGGGPAGHEGTRLRHSVEQVKDSVARDIEMLLNAHQNFTAEDLASYPHALRSMLSLGLVDISAMSLASDENRKRITEAIRDGLKAHDPRLSQVEVGVRQLGASTSGLTFTIRAQLVLKPHTERVVFDAVLQAGSKRYEVSKTDPRRAQAVS